MANVSKINLDGTDYDIQDTQARADAQTALSATRDTTNADAFPGCTMITTFPTEGGIMSEWRNTETNVLVASREVVFSSAQGAGMGDTENEEESGPGAATITRTTVLYDTDGITKLSRVVVKTAFEAGEIKKEVVTQ